MNYGALKNGRLRKDSASRAQYQIYLNLAGTVPGGGAVPAPAKCRPPMLHERRWAGNIPRSSGGRKRQPAVSSNCRMDAAGASRTNRTRPARRAVQRSFGRKKRVPERAVWHVVCRWWKRLRIPENRKGDPYLFIRMCFRSNSSSSGKLPAARPEKIFSAGGRSRPR